MGLLDQWEHQFPNCEPMAHLLKTVFKDRWVRFHSLPESKRYPEDETEYAVVLDRHNRVLSELANAERSLVLLTTEFSESPTPLLTRPELRALDPEAVPWRSIPMHELDGDFDNPNFWHVLASVREWHPGAFDPIVRLVANDVVPNVMIVNPDCRWLLHPYDGGMDVIAETSVERERLKLSHADWLSSEHDGL
ncbi:DUF3885 domain-containing protein [Fimbriiglobus ruber]|uniref:DUF3885 domain-containing protein n=1 Tax=Fimbriiglobus ruber TaxID=1908690 RepID=A0A225DAU1_9BACT|nr:hypothetical protein [Fimbriiglobus ruber]OWK34416.1 hypothetical protein FRUB_10387 [Fimbriiglobus ruber]